MVASAGRPGRRRRGPALLAALLSASGPLALAFLSSQVPPPARARPSPLPSAPGLTRGPRGAGGGNFPRTPRSPTPTPVVPSGRPAGLHGPCVQVAIGCGRPRAAVLRSRQQVEGAFERESGPRARESGRRRRTTAAQLSPADSLLCAPPCSYYLKESKGSRRWLLFLEGGWYCFNRENCDSRYSTMRRLMSSKDWPHTRTGTGILSSQPEENPHWWNANMVFIPYCSSDVWSGASPKSEKNEYAFMGSLIIREVVRELLGRGLSVAKVLLLAGSSAGGTGVLLNVDRVAELLEELGYPSVQVRGLADSGWFLDNKQYRRSDCIDTINCAPTEAIRRGIRYWNGMVPERCQRQFKEGEEWNCFFGYKVYPTLRCPVFVVQWLFDEAQLTVDNVHLTGQPVQEGQWLYIQNLGGELRGTLKDVQASFAPACLSHELIIRSYWTDVQVKGTSLPRALHCWDRSFHDSHKASKTPLKGCPFHLVDSCPWPHCNPSCPTIRDQFTGQEMNVAQFLMHMGFDVQTVAQQQGMEPSKLLGMLSSAN